MCEIVAHMAALSERIIVSVERGGVGKKKWKKFKIVVVYFGPFD